MQERPEDVPTGELPRSMSVVCDRSLVGACSPGTRVKLVGVYAIHTGKESAGKENAGAVAIRQPYFRYTLLLLFRVQVSIAVLCSEGAGTAASCSLQNSDWKWISLRCEVCVVKCVTRGALASDTGTCSDKLTCVQSSPPCWCLDLSTSFVMQGGRYAAGRGQQSASSAVHDA